MRGAGQARRVWIAGSGAIGSLQGKARAALTLFLHLGNFAEVGN
jgi:hypothetical protein